MVLRGIKEAAALNTIATVAKIVPIVVFVGVATAAFRADVFVPNFWGGAAQDIGSLARQVRRTMLLTVFVFVGIEGASVYSRYARKRADVGRATVLGFLSVLSLLILVTMLSYGVMARPELQALPTPSMAGVMEAIVGPWGEVFISVVIQVFLMVTSFAAETFSLALKMTSSMTLIPYLRVAGYGLQLAWKGDTYDAEPHGRSGDLVRGAIAVLYAAGMIYAGGMTFLLLSAVIYAPGSALYFVARREQQQTVFTSMERLVFGLVVVAALAGVYGLVSGSIAV